MKPSLLTGDESDHLEPMAISVLLHAHCGEAIYASRRVKRAVKRLLQEGLISRTDNNVHCPYCNSAAAHAFVLEIIKTPIEP